MRYSSAMTSRHARLIRIAVACFGVLPALALAHPGHGEPSSFMAGALHPVNGADHLAAFALVGILMAQLRMQFLRPLAAGFLGLFVAASATGSDGWQYAAGFMLTGACLVAIAMTATRLTKRTATAVAPRSRT